MADYFMTLALRIWCAAPSQWFKLLRVTNNYGNDFGKGHPANSQAIIAAKDFDTGIASISARDMRKTAEVIGKGHQGECK